jgi:Fe-S-cluster containining protein
MTDALPFYVADPCAPVPVKVSAKSARLPFNGCDPVYIRDVCHASCCRSSSAPGGALVAVTAAETVAITEAGAAVFDGRIVPVDGRCPFQAAESNLCRLHGTGVKPSGCIASPFALNASGTLIVRNRYKLLRCYKSGPMLPAFVAFRASLDLLFGDAEAARVCRHLEAGGGDIGAQMQRVHFDMLRGHAATHRKALR